MYWCLLIPPFLLVIAGLVWNLRRYAPLRKYWNRSCTGIRWRRRFPDSSKEDIRAFLDTFVNAFGFGTEVRCCFRPDDRLIDVYQTMYPPGSWGGDALELETFAADLRKHYDIDLPLLPSDITLGELYALSGKRAV